MGFLKRAFDFIKNPSHSRTMGIVVMLVLISAVSLTVALSQQQQTLKQRASGAECSPPYIGYLGCFTAGNSPPNSICTGSCNTDDGNSGSNCYTSTNVGNSCNNGTGTCDIYGDCANNPSPGSLPACNDISTIQCSGTCVARNPNTCYGGNGTKSNCQYTTYNLGKVGDCTPAPASDQTCSISNCSTGYKCTGETGSCVEDSAHPLPTLAPAKPCNQLTDCRQCLNLDGGTIAPYSCGWNGSSCEAAADPSCTGRSHWYYVDCSTDYCSSAFNNSFPSSSVSPSISPTPTPIKTTPTPTITPKVTITPTPSISPSPSTSPTPTPFASCPLHDKGDADCNGLFNSGDLAIWLNEMMRQNLGTLTQPAATDFNDNGTVGIDDFNIWKNSSLGI